MGFLGKLIRRGASADIDLKTDNTKYRRGEKINADFEIHSLSDFKAREVRFEVLSEEIVKIRYKSPVQNSSMPRTRIT